MEKGAKTAGIVQARPVRALIGSSKLGPQYSTQDGVTNIVHGCSIDHDEKMMQTASAVQLGQ